MHFDLELILVIGSLVTGAIWLLDKFWLREKRQQAVVSGLAEGTVVDAEVGETDFVHEPWYIEYSRSFFPVLFIVLILRTFVAEPFHIPSGSMRPNLLVGDFILVNKFAYGLRLPVLHTKIFSLGEPERGDSVVFRFPPEPKKDYIKRLIGLPGDVITYKNKQLFINGDKLPMQQLGPYEPSGNGNEDVNSFVWQEDLLGFEHKILINPNKIDLLAEGTVTVPPGEYFVMGDNRDNSYDSRFWGFVPESHLVGKAMVIWMNWNFSEGSADFGRIGTVIH